MVNSKKIRPIFHLLMEHQMYLQLLDMELEGNFELSGMMWGIFRPAQELNNSVNTSLGLETSTVGVYYHGGLNPTTTTINTSKQGWNKTQNSIQINYHLRVML